jgi:hypothetical protein
VVLPWLILAGVLFKTASQPKNNLRGIYIIYFLGLLGRNRYKPCMARLSEEMCLGHSWGTLGANGAFFINFWGGDLNKEQMSQVIKLSP